MGGYGGASGRKKDKCYRDSDGNKVKDKNAIEVAEYYLEMGLYVEFLPERPPKKSPDLFVDFDFLAEVKGMLSIKPNKISNAIKEAFEQIADEWARYPDDKPKPPGKAIILSRHDSFEIGFRAFLEGCKDAKRRGYIRGSVEFWFKGEIHIFEEEE